VDTIRHGFVIDALFECIVWVRRHLALFVSSPVSILAPMLHLTVRVAPSAAEVVQELLICGEP
jgi:hypothetical protein